MNNKKCKCLLIVWAAIIVLTSAAPAYAYLDPGTGSMVYQAIMVVFLAVAATTRLWWHKIKDLLGARPSKADKDERND
jgi:hypothetical protein